MMYKILLILILGSGTAAMAQMPQPGSGVFNQPVMPGPAAVLIMVYDSTQKSKTPDKQAVFNIYREEQGRGSKKIASLQYPQTAGELEKRLGSSLLQEILKATKITNASDLLRQFDNGKYDTLGLYLADTRLWEALGILYVDKEKNHSDIGVSYKVEVERNGASRIVYQRSLRDIRYTPFPRFKLYSRIVTDSIAMVTWYAKDGYANTAKVFAGNAAVPAGNKMLNLYSRRDTLFATWSADMQPGQRLDLYIRPTDWADNTGLASDTAQLLAISSLKAPSIQNFRARDTMGGILLQWDALPAKAYYTGIQLFKSRSASDQFIVVDTLPIHTISYFDTKVLSGTQYYYVAEPILFNLPTSGKVVPAQATASVKGASVASAAPLAPQGVHISFDQQRNIVLAWEPNSELDIFAYYVLRGSSPDNMQVISSPVRDTVFVDSIQYLQGGTTYLYAVKAINMQQLQSDTSGILSVLPPVARLVTSPAGLTARYSLNGIQVSWNDVAMMDASVVGYALYRRKKGEQYFQLLNDILLPGNFYIDSTAAAGVYEYGVTAADAQGNQSILSSLAEVDLEVAQALYPPASFDLRNTSAGIGISVPAILGNKETAMYILYRKTSGQGAVWKKIGEMSIDNGSFIDKQVQKDQLYIYALTVKKNNRESYRSDERTIRRK